MNLYLNVNSALSYNSISQKVRIMTEEWVKNEIYCPNCGNSLIPFEANKPVGDFYCKTCEEKFELKSKKYDFGYKITDGAYSMIIDKLRHDELPNFFFLSYDHQYIINNFFVVPKHFFSFAVFERRNPLSQNARRSGWTGCNILIGEIPSAGKIYYVKCKEIVDKEVIRNQWEKTVFLRENKIELRGWTLDVMSCIDKLNKTKFSLEDIYKFEDYLSYKHPDNKHIKDKIRQQLQYLRDKGYLKFLGRGHYEKI